MFDATTIEDFKASLRGELIQANDEGYDDARKVWNDTFDRKPVIIVRCVSTSDVINAVNRLDEERFRKVSHAMQPKALLIEWLRLTDRLVTKLPGSGTDLSPL